MSVYNETKAALDDTRELLDRTSARKEELKNQVKTLEEDLRESRDVHSTLSARWKEKSALIGRLEEQVTAMKGTWTHKEQALVAERDAALAQAQEAVGRLRAADEGFRAQLEAKEQGHREEMQEEGRRRQEEVGRAERRVGEVEEEMRGLLREGQEAKRAMEAKVKRLTQAMGDLTSDLV